MYNGLGISAPPGPKPGTIQDPAATLGWRPIRGGDVLTQPTPATVAAAGTPYQLPKLQAAIPVVNGGTTPAPPPPITPMPPTTPAPTYGLSPIKPLAEPTTMVTVGGAGSPYNAPLVTQLPFAPMAQLLVSQPGPLPGVATPDGQVQPAAPPTQAGLSPTTIAIAVGAAVLLTMLGKRRR